jgi:hypothetical protein
MLAPLSSYGILAPRHRAQRKVQDQKRYDQYAHPPAQVVQVVQPEGGARNLTARRQGSQNNIERRMTRSMTKSKLNNTSNND